MVEWRNDQDSRGEARKWESHFVLQVKACSLRNRFTSFCLQLTQLTPATQTMLQSVARWKLRRTKPTCGQKDSCWREVGDQLVGLGRSMPFVVQLFVSHASVAMRHLSPPVLMPRFPLYLFNRIPTSRVPTGDQTHSRYMSHGNQNDLLFAYKMYRDISAFIVTSLRRSSTSCLLTTTFWSFKHNAQLASINNENMPRNMQSDEPCSNLPIPFPFLQHQN